MGSIIIEAGRESRGTKTRSCEHTGGRFRLVPVRPIRAFPRGQPRPDRYCQLYVVLHGAQLGT